MIQDLIDQALLAKQEKRDVTSWQASKLGSCLSGVYLERMGYEPLVPLEDRTLRVFQAGNIFEDFVLDTLEASGAKLERQVRVENKALGATGYIDAIMTDENGSQEVLEVKSVHSRAFWYMVGNSKKTGEGPYPAHVMQTLLYMKTNGIPRGRIIYCSKDDLCIQEYEITLDHPLMETLTERIRILNGAWATGILPPVDPDNKLNKYCRFHAYCEGKVPLPPLTPTA